MSLTRPFLLEKRPNLLMCSLLLPLLEAHSPDELAGELSVRLGKSESVGPLPRVTRSRLARAPYLSVSLCEDKSIVEISLPSQKEEQQFTTYIKVSVDCPIDLDRSILNAHGDYLQARLAFGDYRTARDTRQGKL
jgi:hypothetical protein